MAAVRKATGGSTASEHVLAFEVGMNFTRYALFTNGRIGIPGTIATPTDSVDSFYDALVDVAKKQAATLARTGGKIDGITFSMPGFIDTKKQEAVTAGALAMLYRHRIGEELAERLEAIGVTGGPDDEQIPSWIENDANCAAMAEKMSGNAQKLDDFVLLTVDTGLGGALFLDGKIRRGKDWRAGEFGMMVTNYGVAGMLPLHDFVSTLRLSEDYAEAFDEPSGNVLPSTLFKHLDDPVVKGIVERWVDYIAVGIFNVVVTVDPEVVLIGGSIAREPALIPMIETALAKNKDWKDFRTSVKRCRHSGNAGLIGAYYAFATEVLGK
ncbi:ROK family protein [Bifidobacterium choloepi]|uniref:ROK family protein n=1 Tax=Bifidobacterium choloepi TaxID=2614131 RepID=A0A6I5ND99_9BIFI|nr:ROK family protein [Bifidobacterium choloepi]NEG70520.1 ROK family protein [Bifidobacterium choloepi]